MMYKRLARSLSSNVPRPWVGEVLRRWMKVCTRGEQRSCWRSEGRRQVGDTGGRLDSGRDFLSIGPRSWSRWADCVLKKRIWNGALLRLAVISNIIEIIILSKRSKHTRVKS